jgi:hypothetical protein
MDSTSLPIPFYLNVTLSWEQKQTAQYLILPGSEDYPAVDDESLRKVVALPGRVKHQEAGGRVLTLVSWLVEMELAGMHLLWPFRTDITYSQQGQVAQPEWLGVFRVTYP